ncbi:MAG: MarR family transcriptional regulator [Solirubrobacteraceae bacterium]
MAADAAQAPARASDGVLAERRSSPGLLLALLGHVAMRRLREAHTAHNLSPRQFHLLGLLHDGEAVGQSELGQIMQIDPSILVTMLNPLEADGLISRERAPEDRRRHLVALTPAGEQHLRRAAEAQREAEDGLFAGLDDEEREQLRQLLLAVQNELVQESSCPAVSPSEACNRSPGGPHAC